MAKKKKTKTSWGRPKGSKNLELKGIMILDTSNFSRKEGSPGLRRMTIGTTEEAFSLHMERLANMIEKKDRRLMSLISPPKTVKKSTKKKATAKA